MTEKVYSVTDVTLNVIRTSPPALLIRARGLALTTGWKNPSLSKYTYIIEPAGGIFDFDFHAEPPTGIVLQVLAPIVAEYLLKGDWTMLKGVRIHASIDEKVALLREDAPLLEGSDLGTEAGYHLWRGKGGGDALPW